MEFILILIVIVIIIAIAYLPNRPFMKTKTQQNEPGTGDDYKLQYQSLLDLIQTLEAECERGEPTAEVCKQLERKRQQAAELLELINPALEDEFDSFQMEEDLDQIFPRATQGTFQNDAYICPNCGSHVLVGDKFCANCGKRLQG